MLGFRIKFNWCWASILSLNQNGSRMTSVTLLLLQTGNRCGFDFYIVKYRISIRSLVYCKLLYSYFWFCLWEIIGCILMYCSIIGDWIFKYRLVRFYYLEIFHNTLHSYTVKMVTRGKSYVLNETLIFWWSNIFTLYMKFKW